LLDLFQRFPCPLVRRHAIPAGTVKLDLTPSNQLVVPLIAFLPLNHARVSCVMPDMQA
jgi:hypothetical protein